MAKRKGTIKKVYKIETLIKIIDGNTEYLPNKVYEVSKKELDSIKETHSFKKWRVNVL